jgi:hypothetical protein
MKPMTVTAAAERDAIEPIFEAGREYNFTFRNFVFSELGEVTFEVTFPSDFTESQFVAMCREYQLDELCDLL